MSDMYGYIGIETLLNFCEKSVDHAVTPNDFMRMPRVRIPGQKPGKWVRNFDGNEWYWFCSNCKKEWYEEDLWMGGNDFPNFCPNCGSFNGGDDESN